MLPVPLAQGRQRQLWLTRNCLMWYCCPARRASKLRQHAYSKSELMQISRLSITNFRGIKNAQFEFGGHTLLLGGNNVGKSTICEALELALGSDRQRQFPVVEEFDFYNAKYLDDDGAPIEIRIEVLLTDVTPTIQKSCGHNLERWDPNKRVLLGTGEIDKADDVGLVWALRLLTIARYNTEEDEFEAFTFYAKNYDPEDEQDSLVSRNIRRTFGFLYLRALRTGSRALSLERGSLLDVILRIQSLQTGIWEHVRRRLESLDPPIDDGAKKLTPVLRVIEARLAEYISLSNPGKATRLFVTQLTREHLRKTLSFFISTEPDQQPIPFQEVGTGTLNTLVLALLSFIAELKDENVIFAMEEPEIALPPHTQRRIADYLLNKTTQCFVTSHSPFVIERFRPEQIIILRRDNVGTVRGTRVSLAADVKAKTYRQNLRNGFAEAMLGKAVVVAEGLTERLALQCTAEVMQAAENSNYPLDLSGVSIIAADGDGSIAPFGRFFVALGIPTFAFYDKRNRSLKEKQALETAGFDIRTEIPYPGMERLLSEEVPLVHQWAYLEELREGGLTEVGVPKNKPSEDQVRTLTCNVLKDGKGWGRAAELIERCSMAELPPSIKAFLHELYQRFPRPVVPPIPCDEGQQPPAQPDAANPLSAAVAPQEA